MGCKTTKGTEIAVPELEVEINRPVLEEIPELDVSDWTENQIEDVTSVLTVYNNNLGRLAIYTEALEKTLALQTEYLNEVIVTLNGR